MLVITVSFIPVFSLTAQEGRLFRPLAYTKTFSMFFASLLGVMLVPVLMLWFIRGAKVKPDMTGDWMARLRYEGRRGNGNVSFSVNVKP